LPVPVAGEPVAVSALDGSAFHQLAPTVEAAVLDGSFTGSSHSDTLERPRAWVAEVANAAQCGHMLGHAQA